MHELERLARAVGLVAVSQHERRLRRARALYESLGDTYAGGIPDYALDPDGCPEKNVIYYKKLTE